MCIIESTQFMLSTMYKQSFTTLLCTIYLFLSISRLFDIFLNTLFNIYYVNMSIFIKLLEYSAFTYFLKLYFSNPHYPHYPQRYAHMFEYPFIYMYFNTCRIEIYNFIQVIHSLHKILWIT